MSRINSFLQNLRLLLTDDFLKRWETQDHRQDESAAHVSEQIGELSRRLDEKFDAFDTRADAYEKAVDTRLDERFDALDRRLDDYQSALDARIDERLAGSERTIDERLAGSERTIDERLAEVEKQIHVRVDAFEDATAKRADEYEESLTIRLTEFEQTHSHRADDYETAISQRATVFEQAIDERLTGFEGAMKLHAEEVEKELIRRADDYESAATQRANDYESAATQRANDYESAATQRANDYESALDARLEARFIAAETRLDARTAETESKLDAESAEAIARLDKRFDERVTSTDVRLDERFVRIERHIDTRFHALEERSDSRMEAHERLIDGKLHQRSQDIVDRNDLMLQIFDQRLDKLRRELRRGLPTQQPGAAPVPASTDETPPADAAQNGSISPLDETPPDQLVSFRKLAESGASALKKVQTGATSLYEQILAWKKIAHEGILVFTPDEQEMVDYILSFLDDPKEIHYTEQHLRRFIATLERIPPAQSSSDRLLELGSLFHLAPAIKKYCGYHEIHCADVWEGEPVVEEVLKQKNGPEIHSFELRNFNVEADPFPYPDDFFKVVLCCELIEHLRQDPMHMLWECNRVLQEDGYLLLTTPNIASARAIEGLLVGCAPYLLAQYNIHEIADQHNREYAPYEIGVALAASGFTVVALETSDVWLRSNPAILDLLRQVQITTELRGDNIFALARKTGAPIERYPKELYTD